MPHVGDSPLTMLKVPHLGGSPMCTPRGTTRSPNRYGKAANSGDDSPSKGSVYSPGQPTGSSRRTFKRPERAVM